MFITFQKHIEKQLNIFIKSVQSNNGGEFVGCRSYLESHGILHCFSCPYMPQQNGRAERKLHHLVETSLTLLARASFLENS